jgi:basic membrane lipoprotein Med (substrate-binding protein (PBP1-ABC) superfamily)
VAGMSKAGKNRIPSATRRKDLPAGGKRGRGKTRPSRILIAATAVAVIAAAATAYAIWPRHHGPTPPAPASQVGTYHRACILTDPGDPSLLVARSGLEQAARAKGDIDVQSYPIPTAGSNAAPYLAGLINNKCTLIVALGTQPSAAVRAFAENNPSTTLRFIVTEGQAARSAVVTALPAAGLTPQALAALAENDFS